MRPAKYFAIVLLLALASCGRGDIAKLVVPMQDDMIARGYIDQLRARQFSRIERDLDPSIRGAIDENMLNKMAGVFPSDEAISVKVVGAQTTVNKVLGAQPSETTIVNISYEFQFPSRWLLANVATQKSADRATIIGFHIYPTADSLESTHRFTLAGKSLFHYAFLALMFLIPVFIVSVLVICVRTKIAKRKWLWILFILCGFSAVSINWTTGAWAIQPVYILFLGAGASANPYGPWILSCAFPLGAIVFLIRRKHLVGTATTTAPEDVPAT
jgi:hypothetical protein